MIVISDNSALSALANADMLDLLPRLFGQVRIPEDVRRECAHPRAPLQLREWISRPPEWLEIVANPERNLPETCGLGPGEASAITLAWGNRNSARLILDEKRGRRVAQALGLPMTGVLGLLAEAADRGWIDFDEAVARIVQTGFFVSPSLIDTVRSRIRR